jgi:hypothetical protein
VIGIRRLVPPVVAIVATLLGVPSVAHAVPSVTGPVVKLNHTEVAPGDLLLVTIDGFKAQTVTIATCGNEARRGSADCDMVDSKGVRIEATGSPTVTKAGVFAPPVGCPCVIRVSSQTNDEVVVVPITLLGHPIEPIVASPSPDTPLVAVSVDATAAPRGLVGWVRSNLGGSVPYEVTVIVKNLTTGTLHHVTLFGSVGHGAGDEIAPLDLDNPGELAPGQTWTQVVAAEVPAPSLSSVQWQVVASLAGPRVVATATTKHRPVVLLILTMVLVVSFSLLAIRYRMRRRALQEVGAGQELAVLSRS